MPTKLIFFLIGDQLQQFIMTWKSLINNNNWPSRFSTSLKQHALVSLKYFILLPPYFLKECWSSVSTNALGPCSHKFPTATSSSEAKEVSVKVSKLNSH